MQDPQNIQTNQLDDDADSSSVSAQETEGNDAEGINAAVNKDEVDIVQPNYEELLKQAESKSIEHHDAWLRAKADAENIRRRAQSDVVNAHKYAIENFSAELLAVMDSLEAALAVENATVENFKNGMELTQKQLATVFDKFNIKMIDPNGEKFDPHLHQAMCTVDSDLAPNTVVQVMQKGYLLHDRVIRPAMVSVSKAKDT